MFSLSGILKKSGSVGRWETKQFIRMALQNENSKINIENNGTVRFNRECIAHMRTHF